MDGIDQHVSVLYHEALSGLCIQPGGGYIDATVGAAGHAAGILEASSPHGLLLGLDADPDAILYAGRALQRFGERVTLRTASFRHLAQTSRECSFGQVDGILMDLGLSSRQLADGSRGFSFSQEGPLDMRFDPRVGQPASYLVDRLAQDELADLFWRYGEERHSRRIARAIVDSRPLTTTKELADVIVRAVGHREKIHPATRVFQALRIVVNDELVALAESLPQARDLLHPGGRLVVISFHSLEDRIVKRFLQREASNCVCPPDIPICTCGHVATMRLPSRAAIRPTTEETVVNPRSRSAKLRIGERL
jgi:16S rRNA (cytosine1402-N4)-methyltransferase